MTHHPRHRQLHKRAQRALTELLHAAARALRLIEQHTSTTIHVQMDAKRSPWDSMVAQSNAVYYAKNAEKLAKVNQSWREANPERLKQIRDDHYQQNKVRYNTASKGRKTHIARATPSWADLDAITTEDCVMKTIFVLVTALCLTGCGVWDRSVAGITGIAHTCVDGVMYLQFTSGASVAYLPDGKIKTCN